MLTGIKNSFKHTFFWLKSSQKNIEYSDQSAIIDDIIDDYLIVKTDEQKSDQMPDNNNLAIYCVHGTADGAKAFTSVAERLSRDLAGQFSKIHLVAFSNRFQGNGIEIFAEQLANLIQKNDDKNIILMGHSRGGLVITYFEKFLAKKLNVDVLAAIPICAPFGGSPMASTPLLANLSDSIAQMKVGSEFLKNLNQEMNKIEEKYLFFAAENDLLVSLDASCPAKYRDQLIIIERNRHLSILHSEQFLKKLSEILQELIPQLGLFNQEERARINYF